MLAPRWIPGAVVAFMVAAAVPSAMAGDGDRDCLGRDHDAKRVTCERAEAGSVAAEFSYVVRDRRLYTEHRERRIRIVRDGRVLVDEALPRPPGCDAGCSRFVTPSDPTGHGPVWVRDLDADGEPEVAVDLWTGGASCCTFTVIYGFRPATSSYRRASEVWGTGYRLRRLGDDDKLQFWGSDQRFKYAFTCGACAPLPLRVWQFQAGRLSVATREFPSAVRRNAARSWRAYVQARRNPRAFVRGMTRGRLASWVADQCTLGRCRRGLRAVRRAGRRGELRRFHAFDVGPYGDRYVRKLKRLLRRYGYRR